MKKEIMTACSGVIFAAALAAQPVQADEQSYVAKASEEGKFCAKVEVRDVTGQTRMKRKCRTIAQWEKMGYQVTTPVRVDLGEQHVD